MDGFASVQIGRTKTGKTTYVKQLVKNIFENDPNREIFIYDPNNEFKEFYPEPFVTMDAFLDQIKDVKNSLILFEEATIFFSTRSRSDILVDKLVRKRHDGNIILLNFHSWRSVPTYIFDMVDYVTIFKTNDTEEKIKLKCDRDLVINTFRMVRDSKDPFKKRVINLYGS